MSNSIVRFSAKSTARSLLRTENISKVYSNGTRALDNISVEIKEDDFIVIIGSSGAGKSTFLRSLNRLVTPTRGRIYLNGNDITGVTGKKLRMVRRDVGMIFQQFHLVRRLTVLENVLVGRLRHANSPARFTGSLLRKFSRSEEETAFKLLKQVGIAELAYQRADSLSGGQQQRVAIARTLAQEPDLFLADEPIASLDPKSSETVMALLKQIHEERRIPVVVNLHHLDFARRYGKRILGISDGKLVFDGTRDELTRDVVENIYKNEVQEDVLVRSA